MAVTWGDPIRPSPAILVRAGLVPSSSGPLDLTESFACSGTHANAIAKTRARKRVFMLTPLALLCGRDKPRVYHALRRGPGGHGSASHVGQASRRPGRCRVW